VRKICVVTGSRAEYGLLRWLMEGINHSPDLDLQVCVTGMHLSPEYGLTYREIEKDGFSIDAKVESLLSSDSPSGVAKSIGIGTIGFADCLEELKPDLLLVLGDRYEILSSVIAALIARIPVAHLHGGETTEGAFDEAIRHSITKMSHLHFVAAEEYRTRVIQLGEDPSRVFCVGGLGVDNILRTECLDRIGLECSLDFSLGKKNLLVTFHPVTLEKNTSCEQMEELLNALSELKETHIIFTMPNADTDGRNIFQMIQEFTSSRPTAKAFTSLGQLKYLSCIYHVDGVVGNSSSGLAEAPTFKKATVNIGDRQRGRLKAASVVDCAPRKASIITAIEKIYTSEFKSILHDVINPYGSGGASKKILQILETTSCQQQDLKKSFYDLPPNGPKVQG